MKTALIFAFLFFFGSIAVAETPKDAAADAGADAPLAIPSAVEFIENSLKAYDRVLYAYKDYLDGVNAYGERLWLGENHDDIPKMKDDAGGMNGTTGIFASIDFRKHRWGGYMFVPKGEWGIPEEEDARDAPVPNSPDSPASGENRGSAAKPKGLDLTGAKKLVFHAKGQKGGEKVRFFLGGFGQTTIFPGPHTDSLPRISTDYVFLSDDWERFEISLGTFDLGNVICGFGWMADDFMNTEAPEIGFFVDDVRFEFDEDRVRPMFLPSYGPAPAGTEEAVINNASWIYDQSLAVVALSRGGKPERARQMADAIAHVLENDPRSRDGRLANVYINGSPLLNLNRHPTFRDDGVSSGNCAWAILALTEAHSLAPTGTRYLDAAKKIADFVLTLDTGKGFAGGYGGTAENPSKLTYLSTEHNADLISAFGRLATLTGEEKYDKASESAKAFVLSMYDKRGGHFLAGTLPDGATPNKSVVPLDCQTWTLLSLWEKPFADAAKITSYVEKHMRFEDGYGFAADMRGGIWNEGTAQMGVLMAFLGKTAGKDRITAFLNANRYPDGSIAAADRDKVPTGFEWFYDKRKHLGATAWLAFLQEGGTNPFSL
ncbi:MAG: hypothetical protein LBF41_09350 [Deltaproteobacteria bacterium]|jgi:hypothetical protein|nr:hypothetical protein [Deltaproteobacteria bacterium]